MANHPHHNKETRFNERCYALLMQVPPGQVTTYKALARALNTQAYRAVGNAMANNPTPIVVPCHRVVKSNGDVGEYALGINKKVQLLQQEGLVIKHGKVQDFAEKLFEFKLSSE